MNDESKRRYVEIWQRILRTNPEQVFGDSYKILAYPETKHPDDIIAQPGFVGQNYKAGGYIFVGMNPGKPKNDMERSGDRKQLEILKALENSDMEEGFHLFNKLSSTLIEIMPTWRIFKNFVAPILRNTKRTLQDVAYVNLLKWRTILNKSLNKLYDKSWDLHTKEQISILNPSIIIALGKDAEKAYMRHDELGVKIIGIPRVIGCNIDDRGRAAIKECCDFINSTVGR